MNLRRNRKGFTLLEILIVIVILGVVAGLAIPVFTANIEKSKAQEAMAALGAVKNAMVAYHGQQSTPSYTGATFAKIGYDPNTVAGGQAKSFTYAEPSNLDDATFTVVATGNCGTCGVGDTVTITESGPAVGAGKYA